MNVYIYIYMTSEEEPNRLFALDVEEGTKTVSSKLDVLLCH